jgi:O-antigen ligase
MIKKLFQNQQEKVKTGFWLLNQNKILYSLFYLLILFLPTQFGKHFWPNFSFVFGLRLDYLSPTIYLTDLIILLIFVCYFPKFKKIIARTNKKYLLVFLLFLLSLAVGAIGAKNSLAGVYGIIKFLEFSFLAFFVANNFRTFNKQVIFMMFLVGVVFESLLAIFQYFNQGSLGGFFYFFGERTFNAGTPGIANASINGQLFLRSYATFSHPNVLAGFLIVAMLYLLLFFKNKIILSIGLFLGSLTLFLTLSRIAIILWAIYLIVLFGTSFLKKYKNGFSNLKFFVAGIIIFLLIISGFFVFKNSFILQRFFLTKVSDESFVQRQQLITQSFLMVQKNPIFGIGVNNFFNNLTFSKGQTDLSLVQPVHNIFLLVFSETGLIGFCFFIYAFYKALRKIISNFTKKESKFILLLIFSVIFLGFFDHYFLTIQQGQILFSLIFGTALSYKNS